METSLFKIGDKELQSRLFLGTGKFGSNIQMEEAILASESELVTWLPELLLHIAQSVPGRWQAQWFPYTPRQTFLQHQIFVQAPYSWQWVKKSLCRSCLE